MSDAKSSMAEVIKAGERASALTQRLLAFTRKQILEPEILDLNTVVSGMEGMLKRLIGEDIKISVQSEQHQSRSRGSPSTGTGHHESRCQCARRNAWRRRIDHFYGRNACRCSRAAVHGRAAAVIPC